MVESANGKSYKSQHQTPDLCTYGAADEDGSLPAEGEAGDDAVVMGEFGQQMAVGDVPHQDPPVARPGGDEPAVRGEGDDEDRGLVARHQPDTVARHAVPQPETSVGGPGAHVVTVGVEGETVHV